MLARMFTLTGPIENGGVPYAVTWNDGDVTGDALLVDEVDRLVGIGELIPRTPTGPFVPATVDDDVGAFITLGALFYSFTVEGDTPDLPPVPDTPEDAVP